MSSFCCSNNRALVAKNLGSSRYDNKKETRKVSSLLLNQDSNPDRQNQNL